MSDFSLKIALFPAKEKSKETSPDHTGNIEIPAAQLEEFIAYLRSAEPEADWQDNPVLKLQVSAWTNEMKSGKQYLKGQIQKPYKPQETAPAQSSSTENLPF